MIGIPHKISYKDYTILEKIGEGDFGETFLVKNVGNIRLRALKISHSDEHADLEARIMAAIDGSHKNVVELYEVATVLVDDVEKKAICMEYVPGVNLRAVMQAASAKPSGRLKLSTAIDYGIQIARGLEFIHNLEICHMDLKPENIIATNFAEDRTIKIGDFGLSTMPEIGKRDAKNRLYGPPEFKRSEYDKTSDFWAFGLILYEMITGQHLFQPSEPDIFSDIERTKEYVALLNETLAVAQMNLGQKYYDKIFDNTPIELHKVLLTCLQVNPNHRYNSAAHLLSDLSKASNLIKKEHTTVTKSEYGQKAKKFGDYVPTYRDHLLRLFSRELLEPVRAKGRALDIGCGQGDASTCLQNEVKVNGKSAWNAEVAEIHSYDITLPMVREGIKKGKINPKYVKIKDATERLDYPNNYFDYVLTRYYIHEIPDKSKDRLFYDVSGILKPGRKFLVIDKVADCEETRHFYNLYHGKKTLGEKRPAWIPTVGEYFDLFIEHGFVDIHTRKYISYVDTEQWLMEGQITDKTHEELKALFREQIRNNGKVRSYFNIRELGNGHILIDFPVLLICGMKPQSR